MDRSHEIGEIEAGSQVETHSFGLLIQQWTKKVPEPIPARHFPDLCRQQVLS